MKLIRTFLVILALLAVWGAVRPAFLPPELIAQQTTQPID